MSLLAGPFLGSEALDEQRQEFRRANFRGAGNGVLDREEKVLIAVEGIPEGTAPAWIPAFIRMLPIMVQARSPTFGEA